MAGRARGCFFALIDRMIFLSLNSVNPVNLLPPCGSSLDADRHAGPCVITFERKRMNFRRDKSHPATRQAGGLLEV